MNKQLSPKALSKTKHKICAWITPSIKKLLELRIHSNKMQKKEPTLKSLIIKESIIQLYFSEQNYDYLFKSKELKTHRITFYLNQETAQLLWDIEGHWLGEGVKVNTSIIIETALLEYLSK